MDTYYLLYLLCPVYAPLIMLVWYVIGIQYERGGLWYILAPITLTGYWYDLFLQKTYFNLYFWEFASKGEFTISMRLGRLVYDRGWRGVVARGLARVLNFFAPKGLHVFVPPQ